MCSGIAANNCSQVQFFDGTPPKRRDDYDLFYEQLVRVKEVAVFPFAEIVQLLLVTYVREVLKQPRAATWFEGTWTGEYGRWTLAHAGYAGSNNNMGQEVKWRDMKKEVAPSVTLGTFTGALVGLIEQLGDEHRVHLAKTFANLFPSAQIITKRTYDKIQSIHYRTLLLSGILTTIQSKHKGAQAEWEATANRIHQCGEPGAPLHLKLRAYHVDIARDEVPPPGLKLEDIIHMVVPRQSYLKRIDPDGTRPFADVKAEVSKMTSRYYSLIIAEQTSARHRAEIERGLVSAMEVYESFHLIRRQTTWVLDDERVKLDEEEEEEEGGDEEEEEGEEGEGEGAGAKKKEKKKPPPQIPLSCTCKWCCKWTVCEHTGLVASVFSPNYKVPVNLIAETPALRKKTNSIRGLAGQRRKRGNHRG